MRPAREIPGDFFDFEEDLAAPLPLVERYLEAIGDRRPLTGFRLLLVQHQLSNNVAMVDGLVRLGADPAEIHWLDIPYTSQEEIRRHVVSKLGLLDENLRACSGYRVLDPYAPYQHRRTVETVIELGEASGKPLLVLDDGAYVLGALSALRPGRWPRPVTIVEQTTRGIIKIESSAALRAIAEVLPVVDVARSAPKRTLEPPFIAMAVCASLERRIRPLLAGRPLRRALVLGYGAIGEQVANYLTTQFGIDKSRTHVHDPGRARRELAARRGFSAWDSSMSSARFDLVVGCSGRASFTLGDRACLADGAVLASASSGTVELSRREYVELADASDLDDVEVERGDLDETDLHSNLHIRLVDRTVTFVNAGFPVNFDGRISTIPSRYIQPTPVMMVAASVQATEALTGGRTGILELADPVCGWLDQQFRELLGSDRHYLIPPPEEAW